MKGMSLRGNIVTTPDDPVPSGPVQTGDWVIILIGLCIPCVLLAGFAAVKGGL